MAGYSFDLSGRVALVTGASSGIGRRIALLLAESGAKVVAGARRVELLDALATESEGAIVPVAMDVSDEASIAHAYDRGADAFGPIDTVIANAGVAHGISALNMGAEQLDQTLDVNLRGVFLTAREGARRMIAAGTPETGRGRVTLIASITASFVAPGTAAYAATKAGVVQMGRVFAREWAGKGINVNTLSPGYVATDINEGLWDSVHGKALLARFARPRVMDADALDAMALFLCSDASAQVTGSDFVIDDGQSL